MTRAAERLFVSQSTLSKQITELEGQLGKRLFIRGGRRLTLTEEGRFLRDRAREIAALMESTEAALRGAAEQPLQGDVSIGCGETVTMELLARLMREIHTQHPAVRFHLYSGDEEAVLERLDRGLVDMGILLGPARRKSYDYLDLHRRDVFGVLMPQGDPLAQRESIPLPLLRTLPLILSAQSAAGHDLDWFGEERDKLRVVATYNLIHNATYLVEQGLGYALCIDRLVNTQGRGLVFRAVEPEMSVGLYGVMRKGQSLSPAARLFWERLREGLPEKG